MAVEPKVTLAGAPLAADDQRVPLVIGVTGHRDLREEDRKELERRVHIILARIQRRYPSTPLFLLSPLAKGADQLVAHVALAPEIGARLVVPLPMSRQLYEEDFSDTCSLGEFRDLLRKATRWFELPVAPGVSAERLRDSEECRNRQYEAVGKYIAGHSQILIALWDGVDTGLVGGTSEIVRFKREGLQQPEHGGSRFSLLDPAESGPVYHVLTPRLMNPEPEGERFRLHKYFPYLTSGDDSRAEKYYEQIFNRIDTFNFDVSNLASRMPAEIIKSKRYLIPELQQKELSANSRVILDRYGACDSLAIRFQARAVAVQRLLHVLILVSFCFFVLFAHWGEHKPSFLIASIAILSGALFTHDWVKSKKRDYQNKYQDFRALAEGLRVQLFWLLAGVKHSVAWHYLGKQRTELDWIRNAFRSWDLTSEHADNSLAPPSAPEQALAMDFVLRYWIDHQRRYFGKCVDRERGRLERAERLGRIFLFLGISLAAILLLSLLTRSLWKAAILPHANWLSELPWIELTIISIDLCLAAAALIHNFSGKMAYSEHTKRYSRMRGLFGHAHELLLKALDRGNHSEARDLVAELGKEALAESGDWLLLHRERPLEVPHAG